MPLPNLLCTLRGHHGAVYDLAWNAGNQTWASAGGDGVIARWETGATDGVALFQHTSPFYAVAEWQGHIVGGNATGELFFNIAGKHTVQSVHKASVFALHVDGEGTLWSGDGNGTLCRWSCQGSTVAQVQLISTNLGKIRNIENHPEGLLVAGGEGQWCVLDLAGTILQRVPAHPRSCYWAMHWPHKNVVVSGGQDGEVCVHQDDAEVLRLEVHQSALYRGMVRDGVLWTCGRDKDVKAWSTQSLDPMGKLPNPHARSVNALAIGGVDGELLATGSDDRSIKIWSF